MAILLYAKRVAIQKLKYIHRNPMAGCWRLVEDPCDYKYSSARYYETGQSDVSFIKDLYDEF